MDVLRRLFRTAPKPEAPPEPQPGIDFYDISWLAVRGADPEAMLSELGLSDERPVDFRAGYGAVWGDQWNFDAPLDADLARVLVTPRIADWCLAIGGWLALELETPRYAPHRPLRAWLERLSRNHGAAAAFTIQARSDWYGWMMARDGKLTREFLWADEVVVDRGSLAASEAASRRKTSGKRWRPEASDILEVAAETSIAPKRVVDGVPAGRSCLLATTAWGRDHGVPSQPR
jgi:hypothetical protein